MLQPIHLRCEYLIDPIGVDVHQPRLSWQLQGDGRGQSQVAYQVQVADSPEKLATGHGSLWDSGRVPSGQTAHIAYAGNPLSSEMACSWRVRVWDQDGRPSAYSNPANWQMGLLAPDDWHASWITVDTGPATEMHMKPVAYLRRDFRLDQPIQRAMLYVTARGSYIPFLNGRRVGDHVLAPGWTDYRQRIQYQTFDVTSLLVAGDNCIGAILGDGWYSGHMGFGCARAFYGPRPQLLAQLHVDYADGHQAAVISDGQWRGSDGPIRFSDLYMGEWYDARREMPGWSRPGFDDGEWRPVEATARDATLLWATLDPPVRITGELQPQSLTHPADATTIFDLGQNMVGWARLCVQGEAGTQVRLRFAEVLEPDGRIHTANLRSARATDTFVLSGDGPEVYEPHFTFHGFRYVEVSGYPGEPDRESITGVVINSDLPQTGRFECANPLLNQLWRNILWGQRGNFLSVPTDCPQRDERLGWTGDAQIFARTACYNMDGAAFFRKWLRDLADGQSAEGAYPDVAPRLALENDGAPGWGDAGIIVPWTLYQMYGDNSIIEEHYEGMTRWMDYIQRANPHLLRTKRLNNNYADWVALDGRTSKELVATAYWAYIARLMAEMSEATGREAEAAGYQDLFQGIRAAFNTAYVYDDGRVEGSSQTAYVLALYMDLVPETLREAAAGHLVEAIRQREWHLSTGFLGTPYLCPVLAETGHLEVAYRLLQNETYPSWGYMIKHGATTMWERWNGWTEEQGLHDPDMNSFNHYAYGAIGEFLYRCVAGIDAAEPGFRSILIRPRPGGGLAAAQATYDSIRGRIVSAWRIEEGAFHLQVTIPANTTATVILPAADATGVTESGRPTAESEGVEAAGMVEGSAAFAVGSGNYHFTCPYED